MNQTFEEFSKDFESTPDEQRVLPLLRESEGWKALKNLVERYLLKLTYNLVAGTEFDKNLAHDELAALRGFTRYWRKIKERVERNSNTQ